MSETFYSLSRGYKRGSLHASMSHKEYDAESVFYGTYPNKVINLSYLQGKKPFDMVGCGWGFIYALSPIFVSFLKSVGFTGWKSYPVKYEGKFGSLDGYEILSVTGRCGKIRHDLSEKRVMPPRVSWADSYEAYFGLYFDIDSWDGSDIFCPKGTYHIFITQKVKDALDRAKFSNMDIRPISEMENIDKSFKL